MQPPRTSAYTFSLHLEPVADALRRLVTDIRTEQSLLDRLRRASDTALLGREHFAAATTVAESRRLAAGALDRLVEALPAGDLRDTAIAQAAVISGPMPLSADVLELRADAWLAVDPEDLLPAPRTIGEAYRQLPEKARTMLAAFEPPVCLAGGVETARCAS